MNVRDRFYRATHFEKADRLPMLEWAPWWDQTVRRWEGEGLPKGLSNEEIEKFWGLESMHCVSASPRGRGCPREPSHGAGIIRTEADYEEILPFLYRDEDIDKLVGTLRSMKPRHDKGEFLIRIWLDGFFWFPRTLLGIETHLYAFYDQPKLMHRVNNDICEFNLKTLEAIFSVITPDMVGLAEDMSYNHGPMLSKGCFEEFLRPYYLKIAPVVKSRKIPLLVDSDGDITGMVPWLISAGAEGVYPLERQAGVDVNYIRKCFPGFLMMGGYDKMVMSKGEAAMRREFDRLLPLMKSGGFINSVDHQTPPGVSMDNYRIYRSLLEEYCVRAME